MPIIPINGANLHYEERGNGAESVAAKEPIVFAHGLLWSGGMFDAQVAALQDRYRCITFDFRGQGRSGVTDGGYDMDTLTEDARGLIKILDCAPCHFVGLSMGGFVGLRLAIRHPHLLRSLTLLESSADPEPAENVGCYRLLNFVARWLGLRPVAGQVMPILFGQKFLTDPERADERRIWKECLTANHRIGVTRAVTGVIERTGVADQLDQITTPTLIIVGDQDVATPPAQSERMHARIPNSRLAVIPGAGHTSTVEEPEAVNRLLIEFLDDM